MKRPGSTSEAGTARERWLPVALSVLFHGTIVGMLAWGWFAFRKPAPGPQPLAIEAELVLDTASTKAAAQSAPAQPVATEPKVAPQPEPQPPPQPESRPEPAPVAKPEPPKPAPVDHAAEERKRSQVAEQQRQKATRDKLAKQAAEHDKAEHDKAVREQATRERAAAEARAADARHQADEAAARKAKEAAQKAAEQAAQEKAQRESDLRAQLASEERVLAARGSAEAAAYRSLIQARIQRAWIRPPGAQAGINCEVRVTQVPGGTVTGVQITRCNGDQTVRESIEAAVNRASPLPIPSNPDLFDRNLVITFHPDDAQ